MSHKILIDMSLTVVLLCVLCCTAGAQQGDAPRNDLPTADQEIPRESVIKGLDPALGGEQRELVTGAQSGSGAARENIVTREEKRQSIKNAFVYTPIWQQLEALSPFNRENARIQLEPSCEPSPGVIQELQTIELLWNSGHHDLAILGLKKLDRAGLSKGTAVGIDWRVPKTTTAPRGWGTDVQVSAKDWVYETVIDFHHSSKNIFAILHRYYYSELDRWTINLSTDHGQTWVETYAWWADYLVEDVHAAVVADYLYVAYIANTNQDEARIRRLSANDGSVDSSYNWIAVHNNSVVVNEVALATFADSYNNRVYYYAILDDGSLLYFWSDQEGSSWTEISTGITNARWGLDACTNQGFTKYFTWISYADTNDYFHVARKSGSTWDVITFDDAWDKSSITAYYDRVIAVYEQWIPSAWSRITYRISYDAGNTWYYGYASPFSSGYYYTNPDVTARRGDGVAVCYLQGGERHMWYRHRDFNVASNWSTPERFNDVADVRMATSIEWLPPTVLGNYSYGSLWSTLDRVCMFDRFDGIGDPSVSILLNPNITSLKRGDTLSYTATLINHTNMLQRSDFWTNVTLPNGKKYPPAGELVGPQLSIVAPHETKILTFSHTIPRAAPLGLYLYNGFVGGDHPKADDEDHFQFEVIP